MATTLVLATLAFIIPSAQLGAQQQGIQLGVAVPNKSPTLNQFEASIGRNVGAVRRYRRWNDRFPSNHEINLLNDRDLILSIKPERNGSPIRWAKIAAARPGDPLYQDMVNWANAIRPYQSNIWLSFHHEPEARTNISYGNAKDYIAAWRNFMSVFNKEGVKLAGRVWIATQSFELRASDRRHPDRWYPGDAWVEAIAADAFNWYQCRTGTNNAWKSPRQIFEPFRDFGRKHPNEQLMIGEFGSVEDPRDRNRKAKWINDVRNLFKEPAYSQFTHLAYFNLHHKGGKYNCDWRVGTSRPATEAFAALAADPYYKGTGVARAPISPATAVLPATGACTAVRTGRSTVNLKWKSKGYVIRRNGNWLSTVPNGTSSFTDIDAPANAAYHIREWRPGGKVDVRCEFDRNAPVDPCVVTFNANEANFVFGVPGTIQLRKNGKWLATASKTYTDRAGNAGANYIARKRNGGKITDYACTRG